MDDRTPQDETASAYAGPVHADQIDLRPEHVGRPIGNGAAADGRVVETSPERPFRVVVESHPFTPSANNPVTVDTDASTPDGGDFDPFGPDGLGAEDIEEAYRRALEAMDQAWGEAGSLLGTPESAPTPEDIDALPGTGHRLDSPHAASSPHLEPLGTGISSAASAPPVPLPKPAPDAPAEVTVLRALEALLFVGGVTLTPQRISAVLGLTGESRSVADLVEDLNQRFATDGRPYEVQFSQGGYHLELRPEYEKLRRKVYGIGPREVKLTQESLEILALVAYRQPITGEDLERCGKGQSAGLLRQLIRRDLVAVERFTTEAGAKDVRYTTTPRFLDLFGLGSLRDLPEPEDLDVK